jgi:hypothetical protein
MPSRHPDHSKTLNTAHHPKTAPAPSPDAARRISGSASFSLDLQQILSPINHRLASPARLKHSDSKSKD